MKMKTLPARPFFNTLIFKLAKIENCKKLKKFI